MSGEVHNAPLRSAQPLETQGSLTITVMGSFASNDPAHGTYTLTPHPKDPTLIGIATGHFIHLSISTDLGQLCDYKEFNLNIQPCAADVT